jgi:hypothetical protein
LTTDEGHIVFSSIVSFFVHRLSSLVNSQSKKEGIGTKGSPAAGGTGTMYFDDIQLIRP